MTMQILVGLDGSPCEGRVLDAALALAEDRGAVLRPVRAMMIPVSVPAAIWTLSGDDFGRFLIEHGTRELEAAMKRIPQARRGPATCRLGQPADVLCKLAEELGADLVVIGTHGYDGLDRVLGTTAAKVVNRAPCSVLVVR